jgi:hypothetical protein
VSGGRQFTVDDSGALVHKLNDPTSLIILQCQSLNSSKVTIVLVGHYNDTSDPRPKTQLLFIMDVMKSAENIRELLSGDTIDFNPDDAADIFAQLDVFVNLSRENKTVEEVTFDVPVNPDPEDHRYVIWDKIAEGIGNLQALYKITIGNGTFYAGEVDPDWEILACILRRLRRGIHLRMEDCGQLLWNTRTLPVLAETIHGHAMITGFSTGPGFPFHCLDILCSALLTLPALTNISFEHHYHGDHEGPEEGQSLDSMIELLQLPSLREVEFKSVSFTSTLCQAVAKALEERSEITDLRFIYCSFPKGGNAVIARVLKTNTTLEGLEVCNYIKFEDYHVFVAAIHPNTTLKSLCLHNENFDVDDYEMKDLIPVLKKNYGLEEIPGLSHGAGDVKSILQLNRAGRRYLIEDGSSISKGVAVLSRVNDDINSVFLHLLENPRLSDRSAVEMSNSSNGNGDNARSTSPEKNSGEKRGQQPAPSHTGVETRRRLE